MNCVIYYSNTGHSKRIAEYFARQTGYELLDLTTLCGYEFETVILVFPIHCQNIPRAVKTALNKICATALVMIATYGKMNYGNVLYEIQHHYKHNIIAAAYVPTQHSYVPDPLDEFNDFESLDAIIKKLDAPSPVTIPKSSKNPFSDLFPDFRSRLGVKIFKDENCDNCGVCNAACAEHAIKNGKPNKNCIRCLKCVTVCPQNSLHFSNRLPMRIYLHKKKVDRLVIYV